MGSPPHVLRLSLQDDAANHVLVAVSPSAAASNPLDLELLATDDAKAYVMTLSHFRLAKYRAPKAPCSESEWEGALEALLLANKPLGDVVATARIADDQERPSGDGRGYMFIDIRNSVPAHAEALGSLKLRKSNKAEAQVELFDWCAEAIKERDKLAQHVGELGREHDALKTLVAEEAAKIQELAHSKHEFETTHDSWLQHLLNEKKVKIRTQEQLLATARLDPDKLAAAAAAATAPGRRCSGARPGKRKAEASAGDDSDDCADKMDVDVDAAPESQREEVGEADRATTGSETAGEPEPEPEPESNTTVGRKGARPASAAGHLTKKNKTAHHLRDNKTLTSDESDDESAVEAPLVRRTPPMTKTKPAAALALADDDASTASE